MYAENMRSVTGKGEKGSKKVEMAMCGRVGRSSGEGGAGILIGSGTSTMKRGLRIRKAKGGGSGPVITSPGKHCKECHFSPGNSLGDGQKYFRKGHVRAPRRPG